MGSNPSVISSMHEALQTYGANSGGSRNIAGHSPLVEDLEASLAQLHQKESALYFSSGFAANEAALSTLGSQLPGCVIFSDELNHASMIEGIRHSKAKRHVWKHNDMESLESQLPTNMTPASMPTVSQDSGLLRDNKEQDAFQYKSESSSVSGDLPGVYEGTYSATSDEPSAFPERKLNEDGPWSDGPKDEASEVSQPLQNATAYMVSEAPSEQFLDSTPSRSRASSNAAQQANSRPQALALQSAAAVKKRKQRSSIVSLDGQPKPLQIVQEDGQGGSIASADFVSPPRGARRKGPLSMFGRPIPVLGLMCVPPADIEAAPFFALLAKMAREEGLPRLSMGMSGDYETAIMLGATDIRVGTALFGERPSPARPVPTSGRGMLRNSRAG